jgi:hypothetical protein
MTFTPITLFKDGETELVESWPEYYQLLWEGWKRTNSGPPPDRPVLTQAQLDRVQAKIEEIAATRSYVDSAVATRATISYVDGLVATKANAAYVDSQIATRATPAYVDSQVATRATPAYVDSKVAGVSGTSAVPRRGRLLVASSEAPQNVKDGADYVCDGTNDQVEINLALKRASRPLDGFSGEGHIGVELVGPTFYVGQDNATSITMYPSTTLWGNGNGTLISPMYTTAGIDRGAIELLNVNTHRVLVSHLTIARHNAITFNGHGIKFVGGGVGDAYQIKSGNDPFNMIQHVNVHRSGGKGIWCTGAAGGSREMQVGWCVLFNCTEQGLLIDGSSDSQVSDIRATGGGAFPGIELGGGNTRLANSKVYYRGNATGATSGADGVLINSSRCEVTSVAAQDCAGYGLNISSSDATVTHFLADSCVAGYRIAAGGSFHNLQALQRAGGAFPQNVGMEIVGSPKIMLTGKTTVGATGTAHVSGTPGADSYVRVVRSGAGAAALAQTVYAVG